MHKIKLYNASAGSGKTYQLVKMYLVKVLKSADPFAYQKILALTFTNKAAEEMRGRLIEWLLELSNPKETSVVLFNQVLEETGLDKKALIIKSKRVLSNILDGYSQLAIGTLDSFFYKLVKSFAKELSVFIDSEIVLDNKPYIRKAIGKMLEEAEFDKNLERFLIRSLKSEMERDKNWNIFYGIEKSFSSLLDEVNYDKIKPLSKTKFSVFIQLQNDWKKESSELKIALKSTGKSFFDLLNKNGLSEEDLANKKRGISSFFIKLNEENFVYPSAAILNSIANGIFYSKSQKQDKIDSIEAISGQIITLFNAALLHIDRWIELNAMQDELYSLALSAHLQNILEKEKKRDKVLFISDVAKIIQNTLINQPSDYIYEKIGQRYETIFIDEFQDTSGIQWRNLIPLIEEKSAYGQETILVGDPKQAIYRFRGGDQKILVELSNSQATEVINLDTNYRSRHAIVNFNNDFYKIILNDLPEGNYKELYQKGLKQKPHQEKPGFVEAAYLEKSDEGVESDLLDCLLSKINSVEKNNYSARDICVLVRDNKEAFLVSNHLQENGKSVITDNAFLLKKNAKIDLIIRFLYCLDDKESENNKYNFICKFITFFDFKPKEELSLFLQTFSKKKWREALKLINSSKLSISETSFDESDNLFAIVHQILKVFDLGNCAYSLRFLGFVEKYINKKDNCLKHFLQHWEETKDNLSISANTDTDSIKIMTMHKSKGLEYPVVLMPFFAKKSNPNSVWLSYPELPFPYHRVKVKKNLHPTNSLAEKELEQEKLAQQLDVLNLLYVSTTRARDRMYLLVPEGGNSKMIEHLKSYFDQIRLKAGESRVLYGQLEHAESKKTKKINGYLLNNESQKYKSLEITPVKHKLLDDSDNATERGNAWHLLLSNFYNEKDKNKVLLKNKIDSLLNKKDTNTLEHVLEELTNSKELKFLYSDKLISYNEREILLANGEIIKPDRIVFTEGNWHIIDYKTGAKSSQYNQQILAYAKALESLEMSVKSCALVYLDNNMETEFLYV